MFLNPSYLWRDRLWFWNSIDIKSLFIPVSNKRACLVGTLVFCASPPELLQLLLVCVIPHFTVSCRSELAHKRHNILRRSVRHFGRKWEELLLKIFDYVDMTTMSLSREWHGLYFVNHLVAMTTAQQQLSRRPFCFDRMWNFSPRILQILFSDLAMSSTQTVTHGKLQSSRTHDYLYGG